MSIKFGIYSKLSGAAAVSTIVSTRIYPQVVPQKAALPAITYRRAGSPREYTHDGPTGRVVSRWEITCWAATDTAAESLAAVVRPALDNQVGTWGTAAVQECFLDDQQDVVDVDPEAELLRAFGVQLIFAIIYEE